MYGMDSQGFPDIDSWAELIIKLPEHKIGKKYRVTYEEIGQGWCVNLGRKRVNFKATPKVKRVITVSFMSGGKKITYQKTENVTKQTGKKFIARNKKARVDG